MKKIALLALLTCALAGTARAEDAAPAETSASVTFLDSKLFDNMLAKELSSEKDVVEVAITGKISLSNIPDRVDTWITTVGENGELTVKADEPALKPKFVIALLPIVYSFLKQQSAEHSHDAAKNYNASIIYHMDKSGDSVIDKIVFVKKKKAAE